MNTLQTFRIWLQPDEEFPQFKRLAWELVDVSIRDVLTGGVHPWAATPVPADPDSTVTSSVTVYDSLGETHEVALSYTKIDTNEWMMSASCGTAVSYARITFDANGAVTTVGAATSIAGPDTNRPNLDIDLAYTPTNGAAAMAINIPLGDLTQLNAGNTACPGSQNGFASSTLNGITMSDGGVLIGTYSDGQTMALGQVALATFSNEAGLSRVGANMFTTSASSGLPLVGTADSGGRGGIVSQALEGSNTECASIGLSLCAECALVSECCWTTVPTASTSCCPGGSGRPTFAGCAASRDGAQPTS